MKKRKKFISNDCHLAAYLLDPKVNMNNEVYLDEEEILRAIKFIYDTGQNMQLDCTKLIIESAEFRAKDNFFSNNIMWEAAKNIECSTTWWKGLCGTKILPIIASRILNFPPISASYESIEEINFNSETETDYNSEDFVQEERDESENETEETVTEESENENENCQTEQI
ncbi:hypothetical protein NQ314_012938 [Rhamnusium bicolor]|uniref:BTB domain-containing protein n=1 Tax=Rhamnusium bicolor TaxID=1586634 RepID=A0AAV8X9A8_9CUCU|nr:hypothetical protein NQ314_012938 [Rhamnusium bicolor]